MPAARRCCQRSSSEPQRRPIMPVRPLASARDRVGLVAKLAGHPAHAFLRLVGHVRPTQRVAHRCHREAGGIRHVTNRRSLARSRHGMQRTHPCPQQSAGARLRAQRLATVLDGDPLDRSPVKRSRAAAAADGVGHVLVSLSSPRHRMAPSRRSEPTARRLSRRGAGAPATVSGLGSGLPEQDRPATAPGTARSRMRRPSGAGARSARRCRLRRCAPLLTLLETRGLPLFIHPGSAPGGSAGVPAWWPALVPYVQQMHAAWYAFLAFWAAPTPASPGLLRDAGRPCASARRASCRAAEEPSIPTHSWRPPPTGLARLTPSCEWVGIDLLVHGSDRPYAWPVDGGLGQAAEYSLRLSNPLRLLTPRGVPQTL